MRTAASYIAKRAGVVSVSVRTGGRHWGIRQHRRVRTASVVKAMLMAAYLRMPKVARRPLRGWERALLDPMVRRSDNLAATRIRNLVQNWRLARLARKAGMTSFATHPIWGQSQTTAADQTRLFFVLGRLLPSRHRAYARMLLRTIVPAQRWGIAQAVPRGWTLYFKGGWGSGTGAVDHQAGLLVKGRRRVAIAVMTTGNPSHKYGKETLRGVAVRLLRGLR